MLTAAALLLAAQAPVDASPEPAYPADDVLAAFADVCRPIADLDAVAEGAAARGWERFEPDPASPIGELVAFGETEGAKMLAPKGGKLLPMAALRRNVAGEDLVVILSGIELSGQRVNGCRLYDVGETRELDASAIESWVGRPRTRNMDDPAIRVSTWEPGYDAAHDSLELFFIPPGSPAIAMLKVSGVALKADFVGAAR